MNVVQQLPPADDVLIVLRKNEHSKVRLIGFTPAGAGPQFYRQWKQNLPDHYQLEAITLAGREQRITAPLASSMDEVVAQVVSALCNSMEYDSRPMVFFGHSFGALVAFNVCHHLKHGEQPIALVVSAHCGPMHKTPIGEIHRLTDQAFIEQLQTFDGLPSEVLSSPQYIDLVLPVIRSDLAIDYGTDMIDKPQLELPLLILSANQDHVAPPEMMDDWRAITSAASEHVQFEGGHFYIREQLNHVVEQLDTFVMGTLQTLNA